ncbi:MAG: putative glycosyltransferase [Candidatus Moranbacteria bacterium GW2011_GWF2_36_839]|nr:MAG: putative glycosyltransferase [Candidatus Moranbacteria bacterium GW2011_GWF1_36_78]KKQ17683.1 MAG: putative glycosyltransferase [Candidatus Moranbacteria bacterium GW2011_GWF2_36_839]HAT73386.1 hypothetical protein [Candidatus Moranbacteria bacterium]HBY10749.1 hypothetical protein [Candidatus Moranbacteria bacterium]
MNKIELKYFFKLKNIGKIVKKLIMQHWNQKKKIPEYKNIIDGLTENSITVFTSIIGDKDILLDNQITEGANFIAFTNQKSDVWKTIKPYDKFKDDRRNSRIYKIMPHMFFDTEYSIWMDGNVKLKVPAKEVVDKFLKDKNIALWKHKNRDCIYAEAEACYEQNRETPEALGEQIEAYRKLDTPEHNGLYAATVIIRRHTKKINELNEKWWAHYSRYSKRDQISFPVVFPKEEINCIEDGEMWKNKYFERIEHITEV